ncbi:MAG: NAD-dependent epimerase/dehydratase family protein [Thermomicrobiales bacterium]
MGERRSALVTGGAGFVGSHLIERLIADGWNVRVFDTRRPEGGWFEAIDQTRLEVVVADIRDAQAVASAAEGAEVIFHQAAIASVQRSIENPQETVEVNIGGTVNVLEAARKSGCRRVVFASSAAVYGDGPESPKVETLPPRPLSPYAVSKLSGEQLCAVYSHLHALETVALRYFNVYGPRQDPSSPYSGVISRFVDAIQKGEPVTIYGDGEQTRDFVYVSDVVEANMLAATSDVGLATVCNVGTGKAISLKELLSELRHLFADCVRVEHLPERHGDILHSVASIEHLRSRYQFASATTLPLGLSNLLGGVILEVADAEPK